jgi:hypothetical protein
VRFLSSSGIGPAASSAFIFLLRIQEQIHKINNHFTVHMFISSGWIEMQEKKGFYSLVTWQRVPFWSVQSHLMPGLTFGLSSSGVSSMATPVQGLPLTFHDACARSPSFAIIAFTAAAATTKLS